MKRLNTSSISDSSRFPIKKGTLEFLQDAPKEVIGQLLISLIGPSYNALTLYVMYGCKNTGSGTSYDIGNGYLFYFGEIYAADQSVFTTTLGQVAVAKIVTTQYTTDADPVTFTDATIRNVHDIRKITFQSGITGSGISDYSSAVFLDLDNAAIQAQIDAIKSAWTSRNNTADVTVTGGSTISVSSSLIKYKIVGKTMHIQASVTITYATAPTGVNILIPESKASAVGFSTPFACHIFNGAVITDGFVYVNNASTVIAVQPGTLTGGTLIVRCSGTIEIS